MCSARRWSLGVDIFTQEGEKGRKCRNAGQSPRECSLQHWWRRNLQGGQGAERERRVSKGFKVKSLIKACPLDFVLRLVMTLANAVSVA